jgi:hypothetical protein
MQEFFKTVNKMSPQAAKLIFYGLKLATGVLIIGFAAYKYNQIYIRSYETEVMCLDIVKAAFSLFVQFIIGGITLDCAKK